MTTERASVRIVSSDDHGGPPQQHEAGPIVASLEPEAQPPISAPPPQELDERQVGGPQFSSPTPEAISQGTGGSVAERMRARFNAIAATEEFGVPGWELPDGRPGLILVARTFGDRKAYTEGLANEVFIARSTHKLFYVEEDGSRQEIEGGWGPQLAEMIGHPSIKKAADLVAMVISKPDPNEPERRIPNVAGIGALATQLLEWSRKGTREAEEDLGE